MPVRVTPVEPQQTVAERKLVRNKQQIEHQRIKQQELVSKIRYYRCLLVLLPLLIVSLNYALVWSGLFRQLGWLQQPSSNEFDELSAVGQSVLQQHLNTTLLDTGGGQTQHLLISALWYPAGLTIISCAMLVWFWCCGCIQYDQCYETPIVLMGMLALASAGGMLYGQTGDEFTPIQLENAAAYRYALSQQHVENVSMVLPLRSNDEFVVSAEKFYLEGARWAPALMSIFTGGATFALLWFMLQSMMYLSKAVSDYQQSEGRKRQCLQRQSELRRLAGQQLAQPVLGKRRFQAPAGLLNTGTSSSDRHFESSMSDTSSAQAAASVDDSSASSFGQRAGS